MLGKLPYPPEKRDLIAAGLRHDFRAMFLFCDRTGVRAGEAINLAAGHVWDFERQKYHEFAVLRVTKGNRPRRVCLTPEVLAILEDRRRAYGGTWGLPEAAVFRLDKFCRIKPEYLPRHVEIQVRMIAKTTTFKPHRGKRRAVNCKKNLRAPLGILYRLYQPALKIALAAAGLDSDAFSTHSARKSFARRLLKAGLPITSIRDLLGHASVSTTEHYLETLEGDEAMKAVLLAEEIERKSIEARGGMQRPPEQPSVRSALEILGIVKEAALPAPVAPEVKSEPKAFDAGVESY